MSLNGSVIHRRQASPGKDPGDDFSNIHFTGYASGQVTFKDELGEREFRDACALSLFARHFNLNPVIAGDFSSRGLFCKTRYDAVAM